MSETDRKRAPDRRSLRSFDPYVDDSGQKPGDSPLDIGRPDELQSELNRNPHGPAETARLASDRPRLDALEGGSAATSDATAAESAPGAVEHLSDARLSRRKSGAPS
jgi:hypothetical protein